MAFTAFGVPQLITGAMPDRHRRERSWLRSRTPLCGKVSNYLAFWPLNEPSGDRLSVYDGRKFIQYGSNSVGTVSSIGQLATVFTRSNGTGLINSANQAELSRGNNPYTWYAWIYPTTIGVNQSILSKDKVTNREFNLYVTSANKLSWIVFDGYTTIIGNATAPSANISINTWYFVAAWHDPANNQVGFSVNAGTPVVATRTGTPTVSSGVAVMIGNDNRQSPYLPTDIAFDGRIQGVGLAAADVLNAGELAWLYNGGRGRQFPFA